MAEKVTKLNYGVILFLSILSVLFLLIPSEPVFANFSDSVSVTAGIKLTLGNLALSPEKDETITGLTYSGGNPVQLSSHVLKNKGTLTGKLAYQIHVTEKGTTIPVTESGMQLILSFGSTLGDKVIKAPEVNTSEYTFITDSQNNAWIFEADQEETIPLTIKYKSTDILDQDRDIDITVIFLLVQTNASEPEETMFYDKVSFKHELKLKAKVNEAPDPIDPDYWPATDDENWKWNGEVRYNDSQLEDIMYFSEVESSENVRNLNDFILYIELPKDKLKKDEQFTLSKQEGFEIKASVLEDKRRIKLGFSFDMQRKTAEKILSTMFAYTATFQYGEGSSSSSVTLGSGLSPIVAKRIVLSTDEKKGPFDALPIYTFLEQKKVAFKYITEKWHVDNGSYIEQPLSDAVLNYKYLEAGVSEGSDFFDVSLHKADKVCKQDYLLLKANTIDENKKGKLKIILIGNNGNRLVIYRDLMITKETQSAALPRSLNQNEANSNLETKETQAEPEGPAGTKEIKKSDETFQSNSSEETTPTDSSIMVPEEQITAEETLLMTESIQEKPTDDGADNPITEKDVSAQENKPEQRLIENEAQAVEKFSLK